MARTRPPRCLRARVTSALALLIPLAATLLPLACDGPTEPPGTATCPTYVGEWGSTGCARVRGRVVNLDGQPVAGVTVMASAAASGIDAPGFASSIARTDSLGRFTLLLRRADPRPRMGPDTVTLGVRAIIPPHRPVTTSSIVASSAVLAEVARVGHRPRPADVEITLPVTCRKADEESCRDGS